MRRTSTQTVVRSSLLRSRFTGFGGEPLQIAEAEWPLWYSLFVEVRQLITQLHPYLPIVFCMLGEDAARGLAGDVGGLL